MMAGPMLIVSTFLSASMMYYVYGYNEEGTDGKERNAGGIEKQKEIP